MKKKICKHGTDLMEEHCILCSQEARRVSCSAPLTGSVQSGTRFVELTQADIELILIHLEDGFDLSPLQRQLQSHLAEFRWEQNKRITD